MGKLCCVGGIGGVERVLGESNDDLTCHFSVGVYLGPPYYIGHRPSKYRPDIVLPVNPPSRSFYPRRRAPATSHLDSCRKNRETKCPYIHIIFQNHFIATQYVCQFRSICDQEFKKGQLRLGRGSCYNANLRSSLQARHNERRLYLVLEARRFHSFIAFRRSSFQPLGGLIGRQSGRTVGLARTTSTC